MNNKNLILLGLAIFALYYLTAPEGTVTATSTTPRLPDPITGGLIDFTDRELSN
jgi:hypothetical protein